MYQRVDRSELRIIVQARNGSARRKVSFDSTETPKANDAPMKPASWFLRLRARRNASRSHGTATLSRYTVRWNWIARGETPNTNAATAAAGRLRPILRPRNQTSSTETSVKNSIDSRAA